jgi:Tol biopolymer transport system component
MDANILALPFTNVTPLAAVNDPAYSDDDPTLTGDLLELYFDSDRPAAGAARGDIWVAKRANATDPFGAPTIVSELASLSDDTTPEVSTDGLTMYFSSDRLNAGDRDIYVTTRADRASPWSTPQRVPELSAANLDDDSAEPLPDGLHLVMSRGTQPALDLCLVTRVSTAAPWSAPMPMPGVSDGTYDESQQWTSPDLTVIYFVSDRPPATSQDIWLATRPDTQSTFTIQRVSELSSGAQDVDPWLTPDLRTMYFASARTGNMDIYSATR